MARRSFASFALLATVLWGQMVYGTGAWSKGSRFRASFGLVPFEGVGLGGFRLSDS